jgi:hypothetical protein
LVAAPEGEGADAGVEGKRGGEVAVGFGQAPGGAQVTAAQLGVGEARLELEAELVEGRIRVGSHIDILARILSFG